MNTDWTQWLIPGAIAGFFIYRLYRSKKVKQLLPSLLEQGGVIVDVRSAQEFQNGANPKSINIPLDRLDAGMAKLPKDKPIILCCASGARSGMAVALFKAKGFGTVVNAGPWTNTL
jgi:rhodanese-related sulfurtransferase